MGIVKACLTFFFCPHVFIISYAGDLKTFRLWCFRSTFSKHTFLFRDQIKKKKKKDCVFFSATSFCFASPPPQNVGLKVLPYIRSVEVYRNKIK